MFERELREMSQFQVSACLFTSFDCYFIINCLGNHNNFVNAVK